MRTLILSKLLVLMIAQVAFCDLNVEVTKTQVMSGLVNPKVLNNFVLYDSEGSQPKVTPAALITVTSDFKFVRVRARQNLFEAGNISKLSDTQYLLIGPGKFAIEITAFDPEKGIDDKFVPIDLGESPNPPPGPEPTPTPTPSPIPDDEFDNIGKRVFSLAKDLPKRKEIAAIYAEASTTLTENPASTINTVNTVLFDKCGKVLGSDFATYKDVFALINEVAKSKWPLDRYEFAKYLKAVSIGLGA